MSWMVQMLGWFRADAAWGTLKTGERLRVAGNFRRQEFEGDEAMQPSILGFVNHAHSAAAELLDDAVVRDVLAEHS
jgi:hypothetical protein